MVKGKLGIGIFYYINIMRLFLFAVVLAIAVLGCSDGKLNLLLVFWGDSEEPSSSSRDKSSSSIVTLSSSNIMSSSSEEILPYSSSEEFPPSSSSEYVPPLNSSSRGVRSSSSKEYEDYPTLEEGAKNVQKGWASRYWDGCKPHCSWLHHIGNPKPWAVAKVCDINNKEISTYYPHPDWNDYYTGYLGTKSSCEGGEAYTCFDMAPVAVNDTLAYGFAAIDPGLAECGACYQLEFDGDWWNKPGMPRPTHRALKGKTMIVMASNIGGVEYNQFDILIPGGGVGDFDSFSKQLGIRKGDLGVQFGGLLSNCLNNGINDILKDSIRDGSHRATLEQWQECLRSECNRVFGSKNKTLLNGCLWHVDWFMAADNPSLYYKKLDNCPQYLKDKYRSSVDTEPPPLPDFSKNPYLQCSIQGFIGCKETGWYD
jgi:hypothetical protein